MTTPATPAPASPAAKPPAAAAAPAADIAAMPAAIRAAQSAGPVVRALQVDRAAINEAARTVTLAFASETPYERHWGIEILDCSPQSMRAGRLAAGANLLCDHDTTDVVGVVESISIGADRVARAVVRFGKGQRASEVFSDVVDGIRRSVSVGYMIHKAVLVETVEGVETYRVTDWEPYEVSLVSVPADASVGVGRSLQTPTAKTPPAADAKGLCINLQIDVSDDGETTPEDDATEDAAEAQSPAAPAAPTLTPSETEKTGAPTMTTPAISAPEQRNHAAEIGKIAAAMPGTGELALSAIQRGLTVEQFQREALEKLSSAPLPTAEVGLSKAETKRYSIVRAINALANPTDAAAQRAAAFEREVSDAVSAKTGKQSRGIMLPYEVQKRDLTVGTNNAGGYTVATEMRPQDFIGALRNAMVIDRMGARMLSGLQGNIAIPKMSAGATAYWVAESGAPTESQQTFAQVTMTPKTVGAFTDVSRKLLLQSSLDVESLVQTDLATVLGLAIQQAAISGSGSSNQPSGITTQVTATGLATNGQALTWANVIALETLVSVANADVGTLGYLTNAKVRGKLKGTEQFSTTNGMPIWQNGNTPLNGYSAGVTNAVPSNLTKGASSGVCSALIFGNFADLIIGLWGSLDLMVDPYTASTSGTVRVVALQDTDIAIRNVESFATYVDVLTT